MGLSPGVTDLSGTQSDQCHSPVRWVLSGESESERQMRRAGVGMCVVNACVQRSVGGFIATVVRGEHYERWRPIHYGRMPVMMQWTARKWAQA